MMNKEFNNQSYSFKLQQSQQQYDSNITMCPPPPPNAKHAGKSMYLQQQQQNFIRAKTGPVESSANVFGHSGNFRGSGTYFPSNLNSNSGKIVKASKI